MNGFTNIEGDHKIIISILQKGVQLFFLTSSMRTPKIIRE